MLKFFGIFSVIFAFSNSQIAVYDQCGGKNWKGGTVCDSSSYCQYQNPDYSQCLPLQNDPSKVNEWGLCGGKNYNGNTICQDWLICVYHDEYNSRCLKHISTISTTQVTSITKTTKTDTTTEKHLTSKYISTTTYSLENISSTISNYSSSGNFKETISNIFSSHTTKITTAFQASSLSSIFSLESIENVVYLIKKPIEMNNCLSNCSNNGICVKLSENIYGCSCYKNYIGSSCQYNSSPCSSRPCLNNGTCQNLNNSYSCLCNDFYKGRNCELEKYVCLNETCSNKGLCYNSNFEPKCICFKSYSGDRCEIESNELKVVKVTIKTASIIAIIVIASLFLILILCDITKLFEKTKHKKKQKSKIVKFKYIQV
ncbi:unnamed protein product [Brachionus calyciflorus]|uniref:Uncharacterized protein n=1 Tax=Brachionus calyciflorus TaxID=104777 RepID=A0A814BI21_9BILA|nr:unnamed protein product [Brachionus calyciflorus]